MVDSLSGDQQLYAEDGSRTGRPLLKGEAARVQAIAWSIYVSLRDEAGGASALSGIPVSQRWGMATRAAVAALEAEGTPESLERAALVRLRGIRTPKLEEWG